MNYTSYDVIKLQRRQSSYDRKAESRALDIIFIVGLVVFAGFFIYGLTVN